MRNFDVWNFVSPKPENQIPGKSSKVVYKSLYGKSNQIS